MQLTVNQTDAITELINIGYARAAGALSDLTGHRIVLQVPKVAIYPIHEVTSVLSAEVQGEVASVHQVFSGPIAGNALLLMDQSGARMLNELLTNETSLNNSLDNGAREVLTEVGNIVLNACLGIFGNLLRVQVSFAVPRLHVESVEGVLSSITVDSQELQYALMIQTKFFIRQGNVSGYLVIILGITSLSALIRELECWEQRQLEL